MPRQTGDSPETQAVEPLSSEHCGPSASSSSLEQQAEAQQDKTFASQPAPDAAARKAAKKGQELQALQQGFRKRGVLYMSRIPPHLKPHKLRNMLADFGDIERLYLAPEDRYVQKRRKKLGSDTGKSFAEGWVEFLNKADAKQAAALLNGQPMGGKHRSAHRHDLWCIKYLPGFKWDHLTEEIAYQNAVRDQKLAHEISAAKRERDFYMSRVDKAKGIAAQQERKRKRATGEDLPTEPAEKPAASLRAYSQKQAVSDPVSDKQSAVMSAAMLKLIAGAG